MDPGRLRASFGPGVIYGNGPTGQFGRAVQKMLSDNALQTTENEGKGPFKTNHFTKNSVSRLCKAVFMNQGHCFNLVKPGSHRVVAVAGAATVVGNERLERLTKTESER